VQAVSGRSAWGEAGRLGGSLVIRCVFGELPGSRFSAVSAAFQRLPAESRYACGSGICLPRPVLTWPSCTRSP